MELTLVPRGTPDGHSVGATVVAFADPGAKRPEDPRGPLRKGPWPLLDGAVFAFVPTVGLEFGGNTPAEIR